MSYLKLDVHTVSPNSCSANTNKSKFIDTELKSQPLVEISTIVSKYTM